MVPLAVPPGVALVANVLVHVHQELELRPVLARRHQLGSSEGQGSQCTAARLFSRLQPVLGAMAVHNPVRAGSSMAGTLCGKWQLTGRTRGPTITGHSGGQLHRFMPWGRANSASSAVCASTGCPLHPQRWPQHSIVVDAHTASAQVHARRLVSVAAPADIVPSVEGVLQAARAVLHERRLGECSER